jgi:hypothetical protein
MPPPASCGDPLGDHAAQPSASRKEVGLSQSVRLLHQMTRRLEGDHHGLSRCFRQLARVHSANPLNTSAERTYSEPGWQSRIKIQVRDNFPGPQTGGASYFVRPGRGGRPDWLAGAAGFEPLVAEGRVDAVSARLLSPPHALKPLVPKRTCQCHGPALCKNVLRSPPWRRQAQCRHEQTVV